MDKKEGSKILREVQAITNHTSDEEVEQMLEQLRAWLDEHDGKKTTKRTLLGGHDREERGGRNRKE
jgi:hypothetical protein